MKGHKGNVKKDFIQNNVLGLFDRYQFWSFSWTKYWYVRIPFSLSNVLSDMLLKINYGMYRRCFVDIGL